MSRIQVQLKELVDIKNGSTPSTKELKYYDGEISWITPKDLSRLNEKYIQSGARNITIKGLESCSASLLPAGTILMSSRAPIGLLAIAGREVCTNQGFKNLIPKNGIIDSEYLYYNLKTRISHITDLGTGTTFKEVSKSVLENFELNIEEDFKTQKKTAQVLSDLDLKIELNNKINAELESMAKLIYDYWFVQFDFPDENGKPYKSSGGKMVYNEELKKEIPEEWGVGSFDHLSTIVGGSTPTTSNNSFYTSSGKGVPWITPKDLSINTGKLFISFGERDVTQEGFLDANLRMLPEGSVLMSSRAPIGYVAINSTECTTNQGFKSFIPKDRYDKEYLYYTIKSHIPIMQQFASGSTFKEISAATIKTISIPIPSRKHRLAFHKVTSHLLNSIESREMETSKLSELRNWLLPMLMNGQITIKD